VTYTLGVTLPAGLPAGNYTVGFQINVVSMPAGATTDDALGNVSVSPSTICFTSSGQTQTVSETMSFPAGAVSGSYAYSITTIGWPTTGHTLDGTTYNDVSQTPVLINMTVDQPQAVPSPPSIVINAPPANSVYTYADRGERPRRFHSPLPTVRRPLIRSSKLTRT